MAYTPNTWVNRVANGDNRFTDQNNNVYEFTPAPLSVSQNGTPFSAEWMNHIEQGIAANDTAVSKIGTLLWSGNWTSSGGAPTDFSVFQNYTAAMAKLDLDATMLFGEISYGFGGFGGFILKCYGGGIAPFAGTTTQYGINQYVIQIATTSLSDPTIQIFRCINVRSLPSLGTTVDDISSNISIQAIYGIF